MSVRGVLFDLDGTLVDSLEDLADAMNHVLRSIDCPTHDTAAYKYFVGSGVRNLVRAALPESRRDEPVIDECLRRMGDAYRKNYLNKTKPYEGVIDLLDALKSRKLRLAVLSNKPDEFTKKIVNALLPGYFESVNGQRAEFQRKPDPASALQISGTLDISPEDLLYVGDTSIDMETANNAGMCPVGVLWGFRTREELLESGAKHIIAHPMELLGLL